MLPLAALSPLLESVDVELENENTVNPVGKTPIVIQNPYVFGSLLLEILAPSMALPWLKKCAQVGKMIVRLIEQK